MLWCKCEMIPFVWILVVSYFALSYSFSPTLVRREFDFHEFNILEPFKLYSSKSDSNPNIDILNETTDFDEISIDDIDMTERSVESAVKQMLNFDGNSSFVKSNRSPTETFKELYEVIKSKKNESNQLDAKTILESLFEFDAKPIREPFDDRKVMTKLRDVLSTEDFSSLFKDPNIGDIY